MNLLQYIETWEDKARGLRLLVDGNHVYGRFDDLSDEERFTLCKILYNAVAKDVMKVCRLVTFINKHDPEAFNDIFEDEQQFEEELAKYIQSGDLSSAEKIAQVLLRRELTSDEYMALIKGNFPGKSKCENYRFVLRVIASSGLTLTTGQRSRLMNHLCKKESFEEIVRVAEKIQYTFTARCLDLAIKDRVKNALYEEAEKFARLQGEKLTVEQKSDLCREYIALPEDTGLRFAEVITMSFEEVPHIITMLTLIRDKYRHGKMLTEVSRIQDVINSYGS